MHTEVTRSERHLLKPSPLPNKRFWCYGPKQDHQAVPAVFPHMHSGGAFGTDVSNATYLSVIPTIGLQWWTPSFRIFQHVK